MVMTSALHAEGREFNPPLEYFFWARSYCNMRQWCIGNIEASQALAPGSTPGWRISSFFFNPGRSPMVCKNKKPTGGIEPPTFRLQSECSTTKLSRQASNISGGVRVIYRNPAIAQLAERETVDGLPN